MRALFVLPMMLFLFACVPAKEDALPWADRLTPLDADIFTRALESGYAAPSGNDRIVADLPSLKAVYDKSPDALRRYLSAQPAWRVSVRSNGDHYASRRIQIGGEWKFNPSINSYDLGLASESSDKSFSVSVEINLNGNTSTPSRARLVSFGTSVDVDVVSPQPQQTAETKPYYSSQIVVRDGALVVKIYEFSYLPVGRMTRAIIAALEQEFSIFREKLEQSEQETLIQRYGIQGEPSIGIRSNPPAEGKYDVQLRVNPKGPGFVYIKGFDVSGTKSTPLDGLTKRRERIGWSTNGEFTFYANSSLPIRNAESPYRARLEVWFVPDNGTGERKLLEKEFSLLPTLL